MLIVREIQEKIESMLFKGKVIIIYGARRVGKTTLVKQILQKYENARYINCELLEFKNVLESTNSEILKDFIGHSKLLVLDEAQSINNIGLVLKIINDTFPDVQIIATGSSSFDLANKLSEPLTGRSREFKLFPLAWNELKLTSDIITMTAKLPLFLRFGFYPEVYGQGMLESIEELNNIAGNYLYKDILQLESVRRQDLVLDLLKALAFQIGNEVSLNELANLLDENVHTIKRYIELLEKSFVIFRLRSFSRNLRSEISKGQKIYFLDLGIRNSIIQNYNDLETRNDIGGLWENFCIIERIKENSNKRRFLNPYFWRTYKQKEIDYLEEANGKYNCFEFKYNPKRKSKISQGIPRNI
jgi:predicted AAA+ superfamily ATPase